MSAGAVHHDDDPRLAEARAMDIEGVAGALEIDGLRRSGREITGPCPACGGQDRFSINPERGVFNCRHCGGGDAIKLVELVKGCDFKAALAWLVGEREVTLTATEQQGRARVAEDQARKRAETAARKRRESIEWARAIWSDAVPAAGTPVADYLALRCRGLLQRIPPALRFHLAMPYTVMRDGGWVSIHNGPAMVAGVQAPSGDVIGAHRTWLDPAEPKGKARILDGETVCDAKKMAGSKKGGAIRLTHWRGLDFRTLVVGEGIETTLTALIADALPDAAYWCGIDLGNMAGRMRRVAGVRYSGLPDLADEEAFVPPPWVTRLIYLQDGDSDPVKTRAQLLCGLRRARAAVRGLQVIQIAHAGEGRDFNDVLMGAEDAPEGE